MIFLKKNVLLSIRGKFPYWGNNGDQSNKFLIALKKRISSQTDDSTTFGSLTGANKWIGGVLAPSGMIYGIPFASTTVLKINPNDDTASTFGSLAVGNKWIGGVLAPNGMIYGIPYTSTTVLKINPNDDTASTFGSLTGDTKWGGGVLASSGMIYGIPYTSTTVLKLLNNFSININFPLSRYVNKF